MKKAHVIAIVIPIVVCLLSIFIPMTINHFTKPAPVPPVEILHFRGWYPWNGIESSYYGNTVILNGKISEAGFVTEQMPQSMKGRTVTLEIQNIMASSFFDDRMLKITVNKNDRLVRPLNVPYLIENEYIPSEYSLIEFDLPDDFDGKLGFVFYEAELMGLRITATYK